jgi:polyisoprenoid-binding protein YceI
MRHHRGMPAPRRPRPALLAIAALLAGGGAAAQPRTYTLDPDHSWVHFEVMHFGTSTSRGRFGPIAGEVLLDPGAGSGALRLRIATGSVDTGLPFFDSRLKRDDLLASDEHPHAEFAATDWRFDGGRVAAVTGDFTLRGVTRPLTLRALQFACRQDGTRGEVCGGDFGATFYRTTYGIWYGWPFIANTVRLLVQVEGVRPSESRPGSGASGPGSQN